MKALTLTQPWAGLVAAGIKRVENRKRPVVKPEDFGRPFAVHASREIDETVYTRIGTLAPELFGRATDAEDVGAPSFELGPDTSAAWYRLSRITSSVIGVATIDGVIEDTDDEDDGTYGLRADQRRWFFGPIGYVLRDVRPLPEPIPCRGWLGFWTLPREVEDTLRGMLEREGVALPREVWRYA